MGKGPGVGLWFVAAGMVVFRLVLELLGYWTRRAGKGQSAAPALFSFEPCPYRASDMGFVDPRRPSRPLAEVYRLTLLPIRFIMETKAVTRLSSGCRNLSFSG